MIDKLDACETYHIAVMLGGPMGIGPATVKQVGFFSFLCFDYALFLFVILLFVFMFVILLLFDI